MKFRKYGSIENSYRAKTVNYITETGNDRGEWVSSLKIHGANYSLWCDGESVLRGKRSCLLSEDENFYGDHNFDYTTNTLSMWEYIKSKNPHFEVLSIHGEIYGGRYTHPDVDKVPGATQVQKQVCYIPHNDFIVFDIKLDNFVVDDRTMKKLCNLFMFEYTPELGKGTFKEMMELPVKFPDPLGIMLGFPPIEGNMAEGWVLKPIKPKFFGNGERIILKGKNPDFSEQNGGKRHGEPKPVYEMSDEGNALKDALMTFLNENRLRNVLSHGDITDITEKDFGRLLGMFLQDAFGDFSKDFGVRYEALPKKERQIIKKMMNREGGNVIRPNFVNIIDKEF